MDQIYAAEYRCADGRWTMLVAPMLVDCAGARGALARRAARGVAGDALLAFGDRLDDRRGAALPRGACRCRARCSPWRAAPGATAPAVDPAAALPLYVRDKVRRHARARAPARAGAAAGSTDGANPRPRRARERGHDASGR